MPLISEQTFEGANPFAEGEVHRQLPMPYSFTVTDGFGYNSGRSGRFELRSTDPPVTTTGVRAEVLFPAPPSNDMWYAYSAYYPSAEYLEDEDNDILNQWYQGDSPATSFRMKAGRFLIKTGNVKETRIDIDLGAVTYDVWHHFVFHIKHSFTSSGSLEFWHNGVKKVNRIGFGNCYDPAIYPQIPRWKLGIYKDAWGQLSTDTTSRVYYVDNVREGQNSSYEEMSGITPSATSLIYEQTFESAILPLSTGLSSIQQGNPSAISRSNLQAYQGSWSGRFELNDTDPLNNSGTRCEFKWPDEQAYNAERWYGFCAYFPSADYVYDNSPEIITQWHQGGGMSPCHSLETYLDRFRFIVRSTPSVNVKHDLGVIPKDQWIQFVFHIKHRSDSLGLIEIWMNGAKVKTITGDNSYVVGDSSTVHPVGWKIGLYKWDWNSATTLTSRRVLYYDNVRIGNEFSSYAEIVGTVVNTSTSTTSTTTVAVPPPTTSTTSTTSTTTAAPASPAGGEITEFKLVNSETEEEVLTVTNGMSIKLSDFGVTKCNIRAITSPSTIGSVKFSLSGRQSKTFISNTDPYALHGTTGSGESLNYYYGTWNPPRNGKYKLIATPYSLPNAAGTAGTTKTINFTIS